MKKGLLIFLLSFLAARVYSQCSLSVTIAQSAPSICSGYSVTLTANPASGTAPFTYSWSTGQTGQSISVDKPDNYIVTVTDHAGCQAMATLNVTATTTPIAPTVAGQTVCVGSSVTLNATAPGGTYQWYNAAGNYVYTGPSYTTPVITNNTDYFVETTINGCTSPRTQVFVSLPPNPNVSGTTVCSGSAATLLASGGQGYTWWDAPTGGNQLYAGNPFTTPALTQTTVFYVSATSANGCATGRSTATVTVNPPPPVPTAASVSICSGSTANLSATGSPGTYNWYTAASGGSPVISSPTYTTPALTQNTTYYVSSVVNDCEGQRAPVNITVNTVPPAPLSQNVTTCYQTSITLTATGSDGATYVWYDSPGGTQLATGASYTTPVLTYSTTYYVQANNGGCASSFSAVNVVVQPAPPAPSAAGEIACYGTTATLTASSQGGGTFQWFSTQTGGTPLATGASFTTPALTATTIFYVQNTQGNCVSPLTPVTVTVLPPVATPTAPGTSICAGNSAQLVVSGSSGAYQWYDSATGGMLLSVNAVYETPALNTTTTYYVEAESNDCPSARVPVTVTVNAVPTISAAGTTICPYTTATLTAATNSGTINWYNTQTGGNILVTGPSYTTPQLSATTTYYVESTSGSCSTDRIPVTVTVSVKVSPEFSYPYGGYCPSSTNPTPTVYGGLTGTFTASAGLIFADQSKGIIDVSTTPFGTYTVYFTPTGTCTDVESTTITIGATSSTAFTYPTPLCQNQPNPVASTNGNYSGPPGVVFLDALSGKIDLANSTPGTYTITNQFNPSVGCTGTSSTQQITIVAAAVVNAGPDQFVATGTTVQLNGSITGGVTTGTWSGGTGTFANQSSPVTTYTPGSGETTAKLTLQSTAPPSPCQSESSSLTITFSPPPSSPTVSNTITCSGSPATLSATAPGGTYQWYEAASGGTALYTGPNFTTPALTTNTTYYVQTTVNGAASSRTAATVSITPVPAAPVCAGPTVCSGSTTTLVASGSTGSYQWYDAPAEGNLLYTGASYPTAPITGTTSFYVQTTVGGCTSARTQVTVTVTPAPQVTSAPNASVCSGQPLNYTITADQANATYTWSRSAVAGISNLAVTNQTSSTITETLINTTNAVVTVVYQIVPSSGTCSGQAFSYAVTVNPVPVVTSIAADTVCSGVQNNYTVTFNIPATNFSWSRAAVAGISNSPVSGQAAPTIAEALYNTTNATINVPYVFTYNTATCQGAIFAFTVTVDPQASVTSAPKGTACYNEPQNYIITSNIPGATFNWSRAAVVNISNPAVLNQTADTISETLVDTGTVVASVTYIITPLAYGCPGTPFNYTVTVYPQLKSPPASSNSPICQNDTIKLSTAPIVGATYLWTGPNGFTSTDQNPFIPNASQANTGVYALVYTLKGCNSATVNDTVRVDLPPVVSAGPNLAECSIVSSIQLLGAVGGGTTTGVWTTAGTGTFSPSASVLNAQYIPSAADKAAGSVMLTLTSTSQDNCNVATSSMTIKFTKLPAAIAGPNQLVCNQATTVQLNGSVSISGGGTWSSSGTGNFSPSPDDLAATYNPSATDLASGKVELRLTVNDPGVCYAPVDSLTVFFIPPAAVFAGGTTYVLKGNPVTLNPTVSETNVHYLWTPNLNINNDTLKNPTITGEVTTVYTLTVTDSRGCISADTALVKVSPLIHIPNTFTPNGDGINDYWDIDGLVAYVSAVVDVYDRYGQQVFHSIGYSRPWDGTYGGKQVPTGVYYYVIHANFEGQVLSGWVTVLR